MKKALLSLMLTVCLLMVPFCTASAAAPLDLMPTNDDGYTVVLGDGTVEAKDGKLILTNNTDGDFRVTIDTKTVFNGDTLNTSNNFAGTFNVDTATDRAAAGVYNVELPLQDEITSITDWSEVHFEQFIVLVTGKGTFTIDYVEVTDGETTSADDKTEEDDTDEEETTTAATTTTTKKVADKDDAEESAKTGDTTNAVLFATIAIAAVGIVTVCAVSKKSKAN